VRVVVFIRKKFVTMHGHMTVELVIVEHETVLDVRKRVVFILMLIKSGFSDWFC
jgi:hypothetical protein